MPKAKSQKKKVFEYTSLDMRDAFEWGAQLAIEREISAPDAQKAAKELADAEIDYVISEIENEEGREKQNEALEIEHAIGVLARAGVINWVDSGTKNGSTERRAMTEFRLTPDEKGDVKLGYYAFKKFVAGEGFVDNRKMHFIPLMAGSGSGTVN